jgi:hypothetical protein
MSFPTVHCSVTHRANSVLQNIKECFLLLGSESIHGLIACDPRRDRLWVVCQKSFDRREKKPRPQASHANTSNGVFVACERGKSFS